MILSHDGEVFFCIASYAEKDIPSGAGFYWNFQKPGYWSTGNKLKARRLLQYADEKAEAILEMPTEKKKKKTIRHREESSEDNVLRYISYCGRCKQLYQHSRDSQKFCVECQEVIKGRKAEKTERSKELDAFFDGKENGCGNNSCGD